MPESHPVASDVEVCATESVFFHVTVVPTATSRSSGANACVPSTEAPIGIVTADADPPAVAGDEDGAGEGDGDGEGADDE